MKILIHRKKICYQIEMNKQTIFYRKYTLFVYSFNIVYKLYLGLNMNNIKMTFLTIFTLNWIFCPLY